jgi:hypothetical protein
VCSTKRCHEKSQRPRALYGSESFFTRVGAPDAHMGAGSSSPEAELPPLERALQAVGFCSTRRAKSSAAAPGAWVRPLPRRARPPAHALTARAQEAEREALRATVEALRAELGALKEARPEALARCASTPSAADTQHLALRRRTRS